MAEAAVLRTEGREPLAQPRPRGRLQNAAVSALWPLTGAWLAFCEAMSAIFGRAHRTARRASHPFGF